MKTFEEHRNEIYAAIPEYERYGRPGVWEAVCKEAQRRVDEQLEAEEMAQAKRAAAEESVDAAWELNRASK